MTSSMALPPTIVAAVVVMRTHPPSTPRVRSCHTAEEARKRTPTMRQGPALDRMTPASLAWMVSTAARKDPILPMMTNHRTKAPHQAAPRRAPWSTDPPRMPRMRREM